MLFPRGGYDRKIQGGRIHRRSLGQCYQSWNLRKSVLALLSSPGSLGLDLTRPLGLMLRATVRV